MGFTIGKDANNYKSLRSKLQPLFPECGNDLIFYPGSFYGMPLLRNGSNVIE